MELSKQVVSLELAKKLKELDIKEPSLFIHMKAKGGSGIYYLTGHLKDCLGDATWYPAYTSSELMEVLPDELPTEHESFNRSLAIVKESDGTYTAGYSSIEDMEDIDDSSESLADALALLLIHLIENDLWKPTNYLP